MPLYTDQDIQTDFSGEIQIDTKGDIALANPLETYKASANFLLRTDFGDYAPDQSVGCNLGSFIGKTNTVANHQRIEYNINKTLRERVFNPIDVEAIVVPFDINEVLCLVNIGGNYLISGVITNVESERMTYTFPFIENSSIAPLI